MKTLILSMTLFLAVIMVWAGNDPVKKLYSGKQNNVSIAPASSKEMNEGGFFLNVGLIIPSKNCYMPLGLTNNTSDKFNIGPSLEVGNMFRINALLSHAIGVRATWLSASYTSWSDSKADLTFLEGSVLRLGPYFTLALSDEMAIDGFYQIGASYALNLATDTTLSGRDNSGYLGLTHNAGVCFRYKIFSVGLDYGFGSLKYLDKKEYELLTDEMIHDFYKIRASHLRIFVGFRF